MKIWKRVLILALASLMLLFVFASCADKPAKSTETGETPLSPTEQQKLNEGVVLETGVETPVIFR